MNTINFIIIYVSISLLFLAVVGIKIILRSQEDRKEFEILFPKLLEKIKIGKYRDANCIFNKIKENPNYTFYNYIDIYKEINNYSEIKNEKLNNEDYRLLKEELNRVCEKKGWRLLVKQLQDQKNINNS